MTAHGHGDELSQHVDPVVRRVLWAGVGVCAVLVLVGLVVFWPSSSSDRTDPLGLGGEPTLAARVLAGADVGTAAASLDGPVSIVESNES